MAGPAASSSAAGAGSTYPYLARVTNGHKLKISTLVRPHGQHKTALPSFLRR